ncbi:hypothetical protein HK405_005276 [Cladochytrium tenue]|nr:hypothetical protein HK405_005276 [Cladochytrium tenue]
MHATTDSLLPSGLDNSGKVHPLAMSPIPLSLPCSGSSHATASIAAAAEASDGRPGASLDVLARLRAPIRTPRLLLHPLAAYSVTAGDGDAVAPAVLKAWLRDFAATYPPAQDFVRYAAGTDDDDGGCTADADPQSTTDPSCLWVVELKDLEGASRSRRPSSPPAPDLDDLASVDDDAATATSAATTSAAAFAAVAAATETASPLFIGLVELRFPPVLLRVATPTDTIAAAARKSPAPSPGTSPHLSVRAGPLPKLPRLSTPHLATVLNPTFAGCGYATEAVRASLLHIFDSDAEWAAASAAPGPGQPAAGRGPGAASALSAQIAAFRAQFAAATAAATAPRLRGAIQDAGGTTGADEEDAGGGGGSGDDDDAGTGVDSTDDGACPQVLPPLKVVTTVSEQRADGARARTVLERLGFELASPTATVAAAAGEPAASLSLRRGGRSRVVLWEVSRASFLELWSPAC